MDALNEEQIYHRNYYIKNKSRILEKQKMKRLDPSFKIKMTTYYKNYYEKHKDRVLERTKTMTPKQKYLQKDVGQVKIVRKQITLRFD